MEILEDINRITTPVGFELEFSTKKTGKSENTDKFEPNVRYNGVLYYFEFMFDIWDRLATYAENIHECSLKAQGVPKDAEIIDSKKYIKYFGSKLDLEYAISDYAGTQWSACYLDPSGSVLLFGQWDSLYQLYWIKKGELDGFWEWATGGCDADGEPIEKPWTKEDDLRIGG